MDSEINNEVTIASLDKMIYQAIYEIRYKLRNALMKKEFLVL